MWLGRELCGWREGGGSFPIRGWDDSQAKLLKGKELFNVPANQLSDEAWSSIMGPRDWHSPIPEALTGSCHREATHMHVPS